MRLGCTAVAAILLLPLNALAEPASSNPAPMTPELRVAKRVGTESLFDIVGTPPNASGFVFARHVLPAANHTSGLAQSRVVYLNKNPLTVGPGSNDSRTNKSSLARDAVTFGGWAPSAALWSDTTSCIRELFAPWDISFTETDPGNVPHIEAVFGGRAAMLGLSNNIAGVAPFTTDCSIIESSMVFTFTDQLPQDARMICEIQAQEIAHAFGLDHEMLGADPMSYLPHDGQRAFQDQIASCGEDAVRPCGLNGSTCRRGQNSVALLNERLGVKFDAIAPEVSFTSPMDGQTVPPRFRAIVDATDNIIVRSATFYIDGEPVGEATTFPFEITIPNAIAEGTRRLEVEVSDGKQTKRESITIQVKIGAPDPSAENTDSDGDLTGGCSSTGRQNGGLMIALLLCFAFGFGVQTRRAHR